GVEGLDLVEVERGEEAMTPAKSRMSIDDDILVPLGLAEDLLEHGPAERVEPADGQVEDPPGRDVGGFGVHHPADVEDLQRLTLLARDLLKAFEVRPFVDADLAGDDETHGRMMLRSCERGNSHRPSAASISAQVGAHQMYNSPAVLHEAIT